MGSRPFERVLVANRGEIACRIIATLDRLGIESVAVHSDADRGSLHVAMASIAVPLGGATPADSYLRGEAIIQAAIDTVQAGVGDLVYLVGSREAALALDPWFVPVDAAIVGIVDGVDTP